jgi:pyridoxal phosphate enzyme (YggS family)
MPAADCYNAASFERGIKVSNPATAPDQDLSGAQGNIAKVFERIGSACENCGRDPAGVMLLAVSKTRTATEIRTTYAAGLTRFGENYLQEALEKIGQLADLAIEWHFIGPLQANKTRAAAEHMHWVHSIDRLRVAERLAAQRPAQLSPLNVCIQVHLGGEETKSGCGEAELPALADAILRLPALKLRGLMAIPPPAQRREEQRMHFARLAHLLRQLRAAHPACPHLDTLSMGMSDDLEAAIFEGATIVRVGTALFGSRPTKSSA